MYTQQTQPRTPSRNQISQADGPNTSAPDRAQKPFLVEGKVTQTPSAPKEGTRRSAIAAQQGFAWNAAVWRSNMFLNAQRSRSTIKSYLRPPPLIQTNGFSVEFQRERPSRLALRQGGHPRWRLPMPCIDGDGCGVVVTSVSVLTAPLLCTLVGTKDRSAAPRRRRADANSNTPRVGRLCRKSVHGVD